MDFYTFIIGLLIVGLFACMTADVILDLSDIWNGQVLEYRGSGRVEDEKQEYPERPRPIIATLDWINLIEDSEPVEEVDIITLAKSRQKSKPVIQAGTKVRELLDGLGKQVQQLVDYSAMTIRQLKAIAKERKLKGYGNLRKAELILALESMS